MQIDPAFIYRVPQFSYDQQPEECWEELKASIRSSSKDFYQIISDLEYRDLDSQPLNIRNTVWKYFNRSCYRATPYGSFAGLGVAELHKGNDQPMIIANDQVLHCFPDWADTGGTASVFNDLVEQDALLLTNSTFYLTETGIRYAARFEGGYELAEVPKDELTIKILDTCKARKKIADLIDAFSSGIGKKRLLKLLEEMLEDQLLLSSWHPNIIGPEYFEGVMVPAVAGECEYVIAERPHIRGSLNQHLFRHLPALVEKLHRILPSYRPPEFEQFIKRFLKKFGEVEVAVMEALDPEMGVGYGDMEEDSDNDNLIELLKKKGKNESSDHSTLNHLLPGLFVEHNRILDIESLDMPAIAGNEPLPNTLSVLCSPTDDLILLDHLGGATATALTGRFTLANDRILQNAQSMAAIERDSNPDVRFFDVGYITGNVVDNVNRRKTIYDLQLSLLNYDTSDEPLSLWDMRLSVQGGELILRSAKLNCRLIPRLASAYNYLLSDLPVFRLLCDLQHQGIHKNLSLRLRDRIADLNFYPRLQFKNIILSPATWLLDLKAVQKGSGPVSAADLTDYFKCGNMPAFLRTGSGDQTLCFNCANEADLTALATFLQKQKKLYLEEVLIPATAGIKDEDQKPYLPQILLNLFHRQQIYGPAPASSIAQQTLRKQKEIYLPGQEWLYYEIYCHHSRADEILTGAIATLVRTHRKKIINWFFIRYTENGSHIRFRLLITDPSAALTLTASFNLLMKEKVETGIIADIQIRTYRRETGRYGNKNIAEVEGHFEKDSSYVLEMIDQDSETMRRYQNCLALIAAIENSCIIPEADFAELISSNNKLFGQEHGLKTFEFKALNAAWQKYRQEEVHLSSTVSPAFQLFVASFIETLRKYERHERPSIFTSLLHMHINRLFSSSQRLHEAVVYYYFLKQSMIRKFTL